MGRPINSRNPTAWQYFHACPPIIIRLAARRSIGGNHVVALSNVELAITSGITLDRIIQISQSFSWENVTLGEAEKFCNACGFDPTNYVHRLRQFNYAYQCKLKYQGKFPHYLRISPKWESEFLPLIYLLKSHQTSLTSLNKSPSVMLKSVA